MSKVHLFQVCLVFFTMDLISKDNSQGLYLNHSCESYFILEFSLGALKRTVILDTSKKITTKTDYFNGLCQVIAS